MLLPRLPALLLAATTAQAFQNTSPFFLLSSEPVSSDAPLKNAQIALAEDVERQLVETLQGCDRKWYYIFSQNSVSAQDFRDDGMAKLQGRIAGAETGAVVEISEVVTKGRLSAGGVRERLEGACSAKGKKGVESWPEAEDEYRIVEMQLPELPLERETRAKAMRDTDDAIDDTVASVLGKENSAVLVYITTPPPHHRESHAYEMDDPYLLHTDLKRDLEMHARQSENDDLHMQDGLPLFEKYQFLSPPLFMGLAVALLLLSILYVGISAISGLDVSYMAFSKEMGPQAQRKQQQ
ncbi:hypothetical protein LTR37_016107 [Vermiconidia calcicola]|uniref:Uncharacterized protein n=1 Tax=Vermiconidia calcicola TaxID=1690605 RepID=A0ACC3MNQ4_9PEZI|nr:hypothetical protein LTR37_016107 [Vermiconidia calcicola]